MNLFIPPDDLSLVIPEDQTEYGNVIGEVNLVDENGNQLVDQSGLLLIAPSVTVETVYSLHVPPDDLSLTIEEE